MLIVVGQTYDYLGNLKQTVVNFIAIRYRDVSLFNYTLGNNMFADLNSDQIPELAIDRWPMRTKADLSTIIK